MAGSPAMMIVSDGGPGPRAAPDYGLDDLPLVLQDKRFARAAGPHYEPAGVRSSVSTSLPSRKWKMRSNRSKILSS